MPSRRSEAITTPSRFARFLPSRQAGGPRQYAPESPCGATLQLGATQSFVTNSQKARPACSPYFLNLRTIAVSVTERFPTSHAYLGRLHESRISRESLPSVIMMWAAAYGPTPG